MMVCRAQEAALDALAALSQEDRAVCEGVAADGAAVGQMLRLAQEGSVTTRLLAAVTLTNVCHHASQSFMGEEVPTRLCPENDSTLSRR